MERSGVRWPGKTSSEGNERGKKIVAVSLGRNITKIQSSV